MENTMALTNVAWTLTTGILLQFKSYLIFAYPLITDAFRGLMRAFVGCYIAWSAYKMLRGGIYAFSGEGKQLLSTSLYLSVALSVIDSDYYLNEIAFWFSDFTLNIASYITTGGKGANLSSLLHAIDEAANITITAIKMKMPTGNVLTNAAIYLEAAICLGPLAFAFIAMYVGFIALLLIGFGSIYIYGTIGGICIFLAPFPATRQYFKAWVRGMVQNSLLVIFSAIIMSCCIEGLKASVQAWAATGINPTEFFTSEFFICLCWPILTLALLLKAPDFASSISGGIAGSTAGIAGGISLAGGWFGRRVANTVNPLSMPGNARALGGGLSRGYDAGNRAYSRLRGIIK